MANIKLGLKTDDEPREALEMEGMMHFEADRRKGGMEKQLDDMFFGGAYPKKPKIIPEPHKRPDVQPTKKPQQPKSPKKIQHPTSPKKPEGQKNSQRPLPKHDNFIDKKQHVSPPKRQKNEGGRESEQDGDIPQQPDQYVVVDMGDPYRMPLQIKHVHNKPIYIRKFKKVAEDFNFVTENRTKHIAIDVVRPKECDKATVLGAWVPQYTDSEFPPNERAMGRQLKGLVAQWKRIGSVCPRPVLGRYIDPNDIKAGRFSSPEFLSTICCMAEKENNIKRIIEDQTYNKDGFYFVRINQNATWRYIAVDDFIPMLGAVPALATSNLDEETDLWVSLVEKAYAKAFLQGYTLYKKVQSHEIYLRDLTGAPCQVHPMNNPETINEIKKALDLGQSVIAVGNEQALNVGLNPNYSFNVLKCDPRAGLQMRNSWGSIQQKSKLNTSKEGTFNMNLQQCKDFLNHIIIARINDTYSSSVIRANHKPGFYGSYAFKVNTDTVGTLSVSQLDERMFPADSGYSYSPIRIILEKRTENGPKFVNAMYGQRFRNVDLDVILNQGEYVIHVIANWVGKEYDFFLSFYGNQRIQFKKHYTKHIPNDISQHLHALSMQNGRKSTKGPVSEWIYHHPSSNLILITVQNSGERSTDHNVDLSKVEFKKLFLVNARDAEETFHDKSQDELEEYKRHAQGNRKWTIRLQPHQSFTWVLAAGELYNPNNLNKWGFKA